MSEFKKDSFLDLLLNEDSTQEGRNQAAHTYVAENDGYVDVEIATDLALWILYGAKDVTVPTQIRLAKYKSDKEAFQ